MRVFSLIKEYQHYFKVPKLTISYNFYGNDNKVSDLETNPERAPADDLLPVTGNYLSELILELIHRKMIRS